MKRWLLVTLWLILGMAANQNALAQSNSAVAPDGRTLATGTANNDIALWETKTGTLKARLTGHRWPLYDLAFAPDGDTLASWNQAGEAILWDAQTGTLKQWLRREYTPSGEWTPVAFSTDGKEVAVGERQAGPGPPGRNPWTAFLRVWDAHTGMPIRTIPLGPFSNVEAIRFWPDGRHVMLGTMNGT
jgi:WD40 repeat protein